MGLVLARPRLILVSQTLIDQWIEAFVLVAPDTFHVYRYYGDTRRNTLKGDEKTAGRDNHGTILDSRIQSKVPTATSKGAIGMSVKPRLLSPRTMSQGSHHVAIIITNGFFFDMMGSWAH